MTSISKETINRLLKDVKNIIKNPLTDNGIYYIHDDTDMLKGYAMIVGPSDTPYFGGFYFFEFEYPTDYPHSPPTVKYCTNENNIRFNPNLYTCGKVCVSLLNTWRGDQWTSCQTISTVLLTLCIVLCNNPLLNEPGVSINHPDIKTYNGIIEFANLNTAVCSIVNRKKGVFMPFFENFYPYIKEHLKKNYDKFIEFTQNKIKEKEKGEQGEKGKETKNRVLMLKPYDMVVELNYNDILNKLSDINPMLDI